jgi:hypothetical protein
MDTNEQVAKRNTLVMFLDAAIVLPLWLLLNFMYYGFVRYQDKNATRVPSLFSMSTTVTDFARLVGAVLWAIALYVTIRFMH